MRFKTKIIICLILSLFLFFNCINVVNATESTKVTEATDVISAMQGLHNPEVSSNAGEKLGPIINTVIGFIQIIGTGLSVIMATVLGIKYMLASPEDKADVKKQIAPLLIGAIVLFASTNIIQIVANFAATLPTA